MARYKTFYFYLFFVVALLPIFIFRDFTPDNELRYLSITDEALRNHTFFAFTNHGIPYADKPPLFLWGLMGLRTVAGSHYLWLYSLLTLIPAIAIARIFDRWTIGIIPPNSRLVFQGMLLVTGLFIGSTLVLRMDMLMCLFIVMAFYEFWKITENPLNNFAKWLFPIYIFLAVFTKGPLGFLIPLVCTLAYSVAVRKYRYIVLAWGWRCWTLLLPLIILWFLCVFGEGGKEYLNNLLFHQTVDRAVNSFHHARPFYYYLIAFWYCLLPWSLAILGLLIVALNKRRLPEGLQAYFLVIFLTTLILLSCISSKLQIYMLPAIPFIIYASAISLPGYQNNVWVKAGLAVISIILILVLPALPIIKHAKTLIYLESFWCWINAACLCVSGIVSIWCLYFRKNSFPVNSSMYALMAGILTTIFFAGLAVPQFNDYMGYRNLSYEINEISRSSGITSVVCDDVRRPENMDVYLNKDIRLIIETKKDDSNHNMVSKPYILVTEKRNYDNPEGENLHIIGNYAVSVVE